MVKFGSPYVSVPRLFSIYEPPSAFFHKYAVKRHSCFSLITWNRKMGTDDAGSTVIHTHKFHSNSNFDLSSLPYVGRTDLASIEIFVGADISTFLLFLNSCPGGPGPCTGRHRWKQYSCECRVNGEYQQRWHQPLWLYLTHSDRGNMAAIFEWHHQINFPPWKGVYSDSNFTEVSS